jgi:RimJ/RimL family protein N-acetyltransferase
VGLLSLPTLRTERLLLVPASATHLALLVPLNADPGVMRFILGRAATPTETRAEWGQRLGPQSDQARGLGYWIGYTDGVFAGWWSASSFADDPTRAGIGYRLPRTAWGRGLATEGALAMVDHAFTVPGIDRVVASTMAVNTGSRRVLEKVGLSNVDTWVGHWDDPAPGWEQGEVGYALARPDWLDR